MLTRMTIQEAYNHYRINQGLQMHQLRVGAVGVLIARAQSSAVDEQSIGIACLLHDMGNILKSDPRTLPELFEPEGPEYWLTVKEEFRKKYGDNEHDATAAIIRELGVSQRVLSLIEGMGFSKIQQVLQGGDRDLMIVEYADQRVAPFGVVSMEERHREGRERYAKKGRTFFLGNGTYDELWVYMKDLEYTLFAQASLTPESVTDASVAPIIEELKDWSL
ncbi:HD domain-containing protein [bacterium]|nr:HD domain-containing protein [bacterium]